MSDKEGLRVIIRIKNNFKGQPSDIGRISKLGLYSVCQEHFCVLSEGRFQHLKSCRNCVHIQTRGRHVAMLSIINTPRSATRDCFYNQSNYRGVMN